jgi:glycerol kinase
MRGARRAGKERAVARRTGLRLDPYFGTKLEWILGRVPGARGRARRGELAFGTIDSWVLWKLTGGAIHATDPTNASRTLFYDIHRHRWDDNLLDLFGVARDASGCAPVLGRARTDPRRARAS